MASARTALPLPSSSPFDSVATVGRWRAQGELGVDAAHQRELGQPFGLDVDVGAGVEQDARAFESWQLGGQRGTLAGDALDATQTEQRGGQDAAGVAG